MTHEFRVIETLFVLFFLFLFLLFLFRWQPLIHTSKMISKVFLVRSSNVCLFRSSRHYLRTKSKKKALEGNRNVFRKWQHYRVGQINPLLEHLEKTLSQGNIAEFIENMQTISNSLAEEEMSPDRKDEMRVTLKKLPVAKIDDMQISKVLQAMGGIYSARDKNDVEVIDALIGKYMESSPEMSLFSIPIFLTSLTQLEYHWSIMDESLQQTLLQLLDGIGYDDRMDHNIYKQLFFTIGALGIPWLTMNKRTRDSLLFRLKVSIPTMPTTMASRVIFNLGRMKINIRREERSTEELFLAIAEMAMTKIEKDTNRQIKENHVSNTVIIE
jgi:hypothetical protein